MAVDPVRAKTLFLNAAELSDPAHRAAFLDRECAGDAELRQRVEALLAADDSSPVRPDGTFLSTNPATDNAGPVRSDGTFLSTNPATDNAEPVRPDGTFLSTNPATDNASPVRPDGTFVSTDPAAGHATTSDKPFAQPPSELATVQCQPESANDADATFAGTSHSQGNARSVGGQDIAGRYTLLDAIGEGGMGSVYRASQSTPVKRQVALKLIKTGMNSRDVLARFDAERQALALMDHPNIARIYDGGVTEAGQPFFVMELVDGVPLTEYCDQKRLTVKDRLDLFVSVCQAVQHAHQKGIIHRDLKPGNVLVTEVDGRPTPKVIDFGVAKATEQKLTDMSFADTGAIVGTPAYMSPEQADPSSMDIDTRTDVYALGVMLYELLVGSPPLDPRDFKRGAILEMLRMVREVDPPRPSTKLGSSDTLPNIAANRNIEPARLSKLLQGELDWVVMKALEKDRDRRYDTANGFARDIQRYLADEVVEARPPSAGYRFRKFIKRRRGPVIAATALLTSIGIGLVAFAVQAKVARDQRDLAIKAQKAEAVQRKTAEAARDSEAVALKQTERALTDSREKTARMTYEQAQAFCKDGQADLGLLWMARSLELTPPGAGNLDRAIRTSINLWAQQLNTIGHSFETIVANVRDVALSPDGSSMLLVDHDGIARLCEYPSGELRFELPMEADAPMPSGHFQSTFSPDGRYVAVSRNDPRARVWNVATGQLVGKPAIHEEPVTGVSFDPKGLVLVTSAGRKIHFWNIERGVQETEPVTTEQVNSGVEVSRDGKRLLTWTDSPGQVIVWDFESRKPLHSLKGIEFDVRHAGFSPDSRWVVAGGPRKSDSVVNIEEALFWEVDTGQRIGESMRWNERFSATDFFAGASFRPDGHSIVTGGNPIRMWGVPSGKPLGAMTSMINASKPVFHPDGKRLIAFSSGSVGRLLLEVAPRLEPILISTGLEGSDQRFSVTSSKSLSVAPGGRTAIVALSDKKSWQVFFRLLDLSSGNPVGTSFEEEGYDIHNGWVPEPAFSSDGRSAAMVVGKNGCRILDTTTGRETIPRISMDSRIMAVAFSPDGKLLATGDFDGKVRLWNTVTGQPFGPPIVHKRAISQIRFSPNGEQLLVAGGLMSQIYGEARLWDVATSQPLGPELNILGAVRSIAFSPDGKRFATGSFKLMLWDTATSREIWAASAIGITDCLAFTPDGRRLLVQQKEDDAAMVYDALTGEQSTPLLRHQNQIMSTVLSPDGRFVLTSSADQTTRLWDASLGLPLGPGWPNSNGGRVAFSADGRNILMIDEPDRLVRWELPPPIEGSAERIRLAIEAGTRRFLDPFGAAQMLSPKPQIDPATKRLKAGPDPYGPVEKRLRELGGPPGTLQR